MIAPRGVSQQDVLRHPLTRTAVPRSRVSDAWPLHYGAIKRKKVAGVKKVTV